MGKMPASAVSNLVDWSQRGGASTWNKLFDRYYRKVEIYSLQWGPDIDLSKMIVAAAQYAGPIGLDPAFMLQWCIVCF